MSVSLGPLFDYHVNAGKTVYNWGLNFANKTLSDYVSPISDNLGSYDLDFASLVFGAGFIVFDWFPVLYAISLFNLYLLIYGFYFFYLQIRKLLGKG